MTEYTVDVLNDPERNAKWAAMCDGSIGPKWDKSDNSRKTFFARLSDGMSRSPPPAPYTAPAKKPRGKKLAPVDMEPDVDAMGDAPGALIEA